MKNSGLNYSESCQYFNSKETNYLLIEILMGFKYHFG